MPFKIYITRLIEDIDYFLALDFNLKYDLLLTLIFINNI